MKDYKKNKNYIIAFIILIIISSGAIIVSQIINKAGANIKIKDKSQYLSEFNEEDQKALKDTIRKYLAEKKFGEYSTVKFIKKVEVNSNKYYYFSIDDETKILFELSYNNNKIIINYMGNSVSDDTKSENTGYTYLQIMNPKKYKKEQELNEIVEEGKDSEVDSDYNVEIDPKYGYSID